MASRFRSGLVIRLNSPTENEIHNFVDYYVKSNLVRTIRPEIPETNIRNMKQAISVICRKTPASAARPDEEAVNHILALVSSHCGVEIKKILGPDKNKAAVKAR